MKKGKPPDIERALRKASMPGPLGQTRSLDSPVDVKGKGKGKLFAHPVTPARPLVSSRKRPFPEDSLDEDGAERNGVHGPSALGLSDLDTDDQFADEVAALSVSPFKSTPTPKKQKQKQKQRRHQSPPSPAYSSTNPSPTHTPFPKRLRLIVKPPPPPPIATHPAQLPRPRAYGGSLSRLLNSFALLEEGDDDDSSPSVGERADSGSGQLIRPGTRDVDIGPVKIRIGMTWDEFEQSVANEVDVWRRIREMRRRGGLRCMRGWEIVRGEEDEIEEEEGSGVEEGAEEEEDAKEGQVGEVKEGQNDGESKEDGQVLRESEGDPTFSTGNQAPALAAPDAPPEITMPADMDLDNAPTTTDLDPNDILEPLSRFFDAAEPEYISQSTPDLLLNGAESIVPNGAKPDLVNGSAEGTDSNSVSHPGIMLESMPDVESGVAGPSVSLGDLSEPMLVDSTESAQLVEKEGMDIEPTAKSPTPTLPTTSLTPDPPSLPFEPQPQLQPSTPKTPTPMPTSTIPLPLPSHPTLPPSHHEALLAAIPQHARRVKGAPLTLRHRPATLISRYWERRQGAADRLAAAEERRIRAGAKALAKNVVAKAWKDAVAVRPPSPFPSLLSDFCVLGYSSSTEGARGSRTSA